MVSSTVKTCPFMVNKTISREEDERVEQEEQEISNKMINISRESNRDAEEEPQSPPNLTSSMSSTSSSSVATAPATMEEAYELAKTSCPAFQNNECPFKDMQESNDNDIQNALSAMPPSHIMVVREQQLLGGRIRSLSTSSHHSLSSTNGGSDDGPMAPSSPSSITQTLVAALKHVKSISHNSPSNSSVDKSETCPFRSFADTMEGLSFTSLLARTVKPSPTLPLTGTTQTTTEQPTPSTSTSKQTPTATKKNTPSKRTSLSNALKTGTSVSHASAESVHFVKEFIKGNIDRDLYSQLILNLYFVYDVLERELDTHGPIHFPTVHFPEQLGRRETLCDDVEFFFGDGHLDNPTNIHAPAPSPATKDYIDRLQEIARTEPLLLLSHAYTRYLGDLSGGTVLARVARKALNLRSDGEEGGAEEGLRFYHFEGISSPKEFKEVYRERLDALPISLDRDVVERLVAEANVAFVLNMRLFEELDVMAGIEGSVLRPLEDAVGYYVECVEGQERRGMGEEEVGVGEEVEEEVEAKCPFAMMGGPNPHAIAHNHGEEVVMEEKEGGGRCPWPFVFFHDPLMGMQDYQTWIVIVLISCWVWSFQQRVVSV